MIGGPLHLCLVEDSSRKKMSFTWHDFRVYTGMRGGYINNKKELTFLIVQELCESRGGRPGLSVLTSLLVSVDVKLY